MPSHWGECQSLVLLFFTPLFARTTSVYIIKTSQAEVCFGFGPTLGRLVATIRWTTKTICTERKILQMLFTTHTCTDMCLCVCLPYLMAYTTNKKYIYTTFCCMPQGCEFMCASKIYCYWFSTYIVVLGVFRALKLSCGTRDYYATLHK